MKKTAVYKWVTRISEGKESVIDEERSGRPARSRTEENIAKFVILCPNGSWTHRVCHNKNNLSHLHSIIKQRNKATVVLIPNSN
jgi:transposase